MSESNFYFGLIQLEQVAGFDDFTEGGPADVEEAWRNRLHEYVDRDEVVYREDEAAWRFGKVEEYNGRIIGKFGRNFTEERTHYDEDIGDYVTTEEEVEQADVSFFIIFPEIPAIVFNRKDQLGHIQFKNAFEGGFNSLFFPERKGIEVNLERIGGDRKFSEVVQEASRVYRVNFDLMPTNPSADDEMRILDEHIQGMNADDFKFTAKSDDESINTDEEFIRSGVALSEEGNYGDFEVGYERDGQRRTYKSRGEYATQPMEDPGSLDTLRSYIGDLAQTLNDLIRNRE